MKIINNTTEKLADDLRVTIKKRSRVSMAAACFSVYAFEELKAQLENLDELRFIFTSPAFLDEKTKKAQREFYIPRLNRERTLHGSEFEIKLRSEFRQRAISQECAHWIREKARFKSNKTMEGMTGFLTVDSDSPVAYAPVNGFTREDLGCDRGGRMFSMINRVDAPESKAYLELFDQLWNDQSHLKDVTDKVLESITTAYQENSPEFLYFYALYNIFGSFLEQVNEDDLPSETNGFKESQVWNKLYTFQKDAVIAIISKLEQYNGCILADSVGLGKTFTALAVIKYYENRNLRVLVLCPKKLSDNWMTYKANYVNNPIAGDRLRYDVLYHTDLSRDKGFSGEIDLSKLNWSAYDLVVIDESHNFRNGGDVDNEGKENRYTRLMNKVIRPGARTRVLMLSATPVNNRFYDLRNQLALAYEGDSSEWQGKLDISRSVEEVFRNAQKVFNEWSKLDVASRTTDQLMQMLDFEFFQILDAVTIARSRRHIEKYYDVSEIGKFPTRLPPISKRPPLTDLPGAISYSEIYDDLLSLTLSIYTPTNYILPSKLEKYAKLNHEGKNHLTQAGREQGIRRLMSINLLKRLESSLHSFQLTLGRIEQLIAQTLDTIAHYDPTATLELNDLSGVADLDADDQESDLFTVGRKVKIELADMDYVTWRKDLEEDQHTLRMLLKAVSQITPAHDSKLRMLLDTITEKIEHSDYPHFRCALGAYIPGSLYKYFSIPDDSDEARKRFEQLKSGEIWFSKRSGLNDPFEFEHIALKGAQNDARQYYLNKQQELEVCCFSALLYNKLMWSHYAAGYKGYCVEFRVESPERFYPVIYENEVPDLSQEYQRFYDMRNEMCANPSLVLNNYENRKVLLRINYPLFSKDTCWSYEEEYRILDSSTVSNGELQQMTTNGLRVTKIIAGAFCTDLNFQRLKEVAGALNVPLSKIGWDSNLRLNEVPLP